MLITEQNLCVCLGVCVCVHIIRELRVSKTTTCHQQSTVAGLTCHTYLEEGFHCIGFHRFIPATDTGHSLSHRHIY